MKNTIRFTTVFFVIFELFYAEPVDRRQASQEQINDDANGASFNAHDYASPVNETLGQSHDYTKLNNVQGLV